VAYALRPATAEEGGVGHEGSPTLARDGAAEESGEVVVRDDARQDLEDDVVRQQRGRGGCRPFLLPTGGHANSVDAIGRGKMQIGGFILGVCVKLRLTKVYPTLSFPVQKKQNPVHVRFPFHLSRSRVYT
jgi:hypothetical protein